MNAQELAFLFLTCDDGDENPEFNKISSTVYLSMYVFKSPIFKLCFLHPTTLISPCERGSLHGFSWLKNAECLSHKDHKQW